MSRTRSIVAALAVLVAAPLQLWAATPDRVTLSPSKLAQTYSSGPFQLTNATGNFYDNGTVPGTPVTDPIVIVPAPTCTAPVSASAMPFPCDDFALTVTLPSGYSAMYPGTVVRVAMGYDSALCPSPIFPLPSPIPGEACNPLNVDEYDLLVYAGTDITQTPIQQAIAQNPAILNLPVKDGTNTFVVQIVPTQAFGSSTTTTVTLMPGADPTGGGAGSGGSGTSTSSVAASTPRYQIYAPTSGQDGSLVSGSQGEDSVGYDLRSGVIMNEHEVGDTFAITPPELIGMPESAPALWTNVSDPSQAVSLDPILWTDPASGRTFSSNLTTGAEAVFSYTDDDGKTWIPASAAPPNGGTDHQTIATGPYPAGSPFAQVAAAAGINYATYYCSQANGPDYCQRSDTGGASFGPGVPFAKTTPVVSIGGLPVVDPCGAIHGHVKVSPKDGSVWVPIRNCGTKQGGAISTDAGITWSQFLVSTSDTSDVDHFDPSVGIATSGTAYYCYAGKDGHPHVSVSDDDGAHWINDFDIGASQGIQNAVFVEAIAGDSDRAACGFLGTTTAGDWTGTSGAGGAFPGMFKLYIASTFDHGKTWTTVDVAPNNIVQAPGGICNGGTTGCGGAFRNLLDFNEVTMDKYGRILFAFDEGCTGACQTDPVRSTTHNAYPRIARQSGGLTLLSAWDGKADGSHNLVNYGLNAGPPKPPYLTAAMSGGTATLNWVAGDNGGDAITGYQIFRGTSAGAETYLMSVPASATMASDNTVGVLPPGPIYYTVKAANSAGTGLPSNEVNVGTAAVGSGDPCQLPGVTLATSSTGNGSGIPYANITGLSVAEPANPTVAPSAATPSTALSFEIDVSSFQNLPTPPPNTAWAVYWNMPVTYGSGVTGNNNAASATNPSAISQQFYVQFDTWSSTDYTGELTFGFVDFTTTPHSLTPICSVGFLTGPDGPVGATPFGAISGPCALTGAYDGPGNKITLTLDTHGDFSSPSFSTGSTQKPFTNSFNHPLPTLTGISAETTELVGVTVGLTDALNTAAATRDYTMAGNWSCRANIAPVATLSANPVSGVATASGLPVTLNASATDESEDTIASYTFNPGDGSSAVAGSATSLSHAYPVGVFNATVTATNDRGKTGSASAGVTVYPLPPTSITTTADTSSVTLEWTATSSLLTNDAPAPGYAVYWSTTSGGEGTPAAAGGNSMTVNATSATVTGLSEGTQYYFTVYTLAGQGNSLPSSASDEVTASTATTVTPVTPTVTLSESATTVAAGGSTTLTWSSTDATSCTASGGWSGSKAVSGSESVTVNAGANQYTLSCSGAGGTAQQTVSATGTTSQPPSFKVTLTSDTQGGTAPQTVTFTAHVSGGDGSPVQYTIAFGDGSQSVVEMTETETGKTATATHTYQYAGTYYPYVTVTQEYGSQSATSGPDEDVITTTADVQVTSTGAAQIKVTQIQSDDPNNPGVAPATVTFDTTGSSGDSYSIVFDDGAVLTGQGVPSLTITHHFAAPGMHKVTLSLKDHQGNTVSAEADAQLQAVQGLTAELDWTVDGTTSPVTATFDGCQSVPANGKSITTYVLDYGDGVSETHNASDANACTFKHTYTVNTTTTFHPSLTVTDDATPTQSNTMAPSKALVVQPKAVVPPQSGGGGGSLGLLTLLPLMGAGLARRRRRTLH